MNNVCAQYLIVTFAAWGATKSITHGIFPSVHSLLCNGTSAACCILASTSSQKYPQHIKPTGKAQTNLQKAISIFRTFGEVDVGQSMIVQNKIVLGLEAVEGTDNLITRCKDYKKSGDKGVLVKFSKYNQSNILDIPTIGENTIRLLKDCDYEGIFLEKDRCLIIDKEKTIDLANQNKIFISTCNKIEKK